jgi:hypothetical protein
MNSAPIQFLWDGEAMVPASRFWAGRADRQFVVGEHYTLVEHHERSDASHNHYFAAIKNGFDSLPDYMKGLYPTAEHLRKKALIRTGYRDERDIVLSSKADAERVAAFMEPTDEYAVVVTAACVVRVWTAKSQSKKAMGAKEFQASKTAVLDFIDDLLGVERGATARSEAA